MIGGPIANSYASIINMVLKTESTKTIGDVGETYFEADYASAAEQEKPHRRSARPQKPTARPCY